MVGWSGVPSQASSRGMPPRRCTTRTGEPTGEPSALAQSPPPDRGRLLYETHCIACHTTQMHWRDKRVVQDWASLLGQVGAWQARAKLGWNEADIRAVAEHLNATIYRLGDAPLRGE